MCGFVACVDSDLGFYGMEHLVFGVYFRHELQVYFDVDDTCVI